MIIIKNAYVQPIIGIESNAYDGKSVHVLTLLVEAKDINPKDFENFRGKLNIKIDTI